MFSPVDHANPKKRAAETDAAGRENDARQTTSPDKKEEQSKRARVHDADSWAEGLAGKPYHEGAHGGKGRAQKELGTTGTTHESEHPIGYEPLRRYLKITGSKKRGGAGLQRQLEYRAPAYQEVKQHHSDHIGTRTKPRGESHMDSASYRAAQLELLMPHSTSRTGRQGIADQPDIPAAAPSISSAVQLNQLDYAFNPKFQTKGRALTPDEEKANRSYKTMVEKMTTVGYAQDPSHIGEVTVDHTDKAEMYLARYAAQTGVWPVNAAAKYQDILAQGGNPVHDLPDIDAANASGTEMDES